MVQVLFCLQHMAVIVDVIHAVAVVAVALGAVTELHVRVVGISHTADGALVKIALALLHFLLRLFKVDGLRIDPMGGPGLVPVKQTNEIGPEEDQVVEDPARALPSRRDSPMAELQTRTSAPPW